MKEIEVKAKLDNPDLVSKKLEDLGCVFSAPLVQLDKVFLGKGVEFSDIQKRTNVLRIRQQNDEVLFTLKRHEENELSCIEKEVEVSDANELEEILKYLGYHEVVRINKIRRKCRYGDLEVCLDEVERLGSFIEVEKMTEENGLKVQEELFNFLMSLGVKKEDRILKGYDTLMIEHRN